MSVVSEDVQARPLVPTSPPAARLSRPRWRDARLLGGVLLVLVSVVLGARALSAADDSVAVWALTTDLAAGSALHADDLTVVQVRLGAASGSYLGASGPSPVGWVVTRQLAGGELVPVDALEASGAADPLRSVTVAVERFHAPADLARGQRVDVYVTPEDGLTRIVLTGALVAGVVEDGGRLGPRALPRESCSPYLLTQVALLVQAAQDGALDLVGVPAGS